MENDAAERMNEPGFPGFFVLGYCILSVPTAIMAENGGWHTVCAGERQQKNKYIAIK